jgi:hypothetical protein
MPTVAAGNDPLRLARTKRRAARQAIAANSEVLHTYTSRPFRVARSPSLLVVARGKRCWIGVDIAHSSKRARRVLSRPAPRPSNRRSSICIAKPNSTPN